MPKPRPNPTPAAAPRSYQNLWICLGLVAVIVAAYAQVLHFDFVNFDDPEYITRNAHVRDGFTAGGLAWAFTSGYAANWFPLTWISHMLDVQLFGLDAGFHHLTNVLLHALASVLLFAFLERATRARIPSALVAFLFALHPLHVESVAWVAERKDVLSAVFWFLALWAYVRYAERPSATRYLLVLAAFALGLMAKPMIVTLPLVLLVLDAWPLSRLHPLWPRIREKLPFFALSAMVATITYEVQHASGAVMSMAAVPLIMRIENALTSYVVYILKMLWPSGLAVFYPYPLQVPAWQAVAAAIVLVVLTLLAARAFPSRPYITAGWLWYVVTLLPVIGLVQVGTQARADRYMYVPMVGLAIIVAWGVAARGRSFAIAMAAACGVCAVLAALQVGYWRNSETLFRHALDVTEGNAIAEHNLGSALLQDSGALPEAIAHLQAALRINPQSAQTHTDLGSAFAKAGRVPEAIVEFRAALGLAPGSAIVHNNLANALSANGQPRDAIAEYEAALQLDPSYLEARQNLAIAHFDAGVSAAKGSRTNEAVAELEQAIRINPNYADAHNNLGVVLAQIPGRLDEAIRHFETAVRLQPDYEDAKYNLQAAQAERSQKR